MNEKNRLFYKIVISVFLASFLLENDARGMTNFEPWEMEVIVATITCFLLISILDWIWFKWIKDLICKKKNEN